MLKNEQKEKDIVQNKLAETNNKQKEIVEFRKIMNSLYQ
jgi:hypothetical protein